MEHNLAKIEISDDKSLHEACDLLHDARCDLSTLDVDKEQGTWLAKFQREFFEDPALMTHKRRFFFFTKSSFPLAETELRLEGIIGYEILDKSHIGVYVFNECQKSNNLCRLLFCEDMEMIITFENKPRGSLTDLRLLDEQGSYYSLRNPFKRPHRC